MSWGLVLSGGAACGLANIGVLQVLEEEGLTPNSVAGSSMGAIVGALYALGHPTATLVSVTADLEPLSVVDFNRRPFRGGLHGGLLTQRLEDHLGELLGDARIGDCRIPFVCVAGRVREPVRWERMLRPGFVEHVRDRVELHVFGPEVRLIDAVRASSAIPVLFSPARVGDEEFIDLVHFGAIPAKTLRAEMRPRRVIATDTMPNFSQLQRLMPPTFREFLSAGYAETEASLAACDLVLRPHLPGTALRFDLAEAFAQSGKEATAAQLDSIRELICQANTGPARPGDSPP